MTEVYNPSSIDIASNSKRIKRSLVSSGYEAVKRLSSEIMANSRPKLSPVKNAKSPNIALTTADSPQHEANSIPTISTTVNTLFPEPNLRRNESDGDRYFTASSGDEDRFDDDEFYDDDDDDTDGMCIMLESDDEDAETGSLSGLHINLRTLQAVSNMLAHYNPVIQRDINGNPIFVPPPPPPLTELGAVTASGSSSVVSIKSSNLSKVSDPSPHTSIGDDASTSDYHIALQELENVISAEEGTFLSDKMSELTDVMEKMTYYAGDEDDDI